MSRTIKRVEVRTYLERLHCECGGQMLPTDLALPTDPPQYPHKCQLCDRQTVESETFPRLVYDEIGG